MKTNNIIWSIAIVLLIIAIYTTNNYNTNKNKFISNSNSSQPSNFNSVQNTTEQQITPATLFTLQDLNGKNVSLSDYRGKKNIFLNFWATWCPPCRLEMPVIEKIYQEYKEKDLIILAVDLGEDKKTVADFINTNKYNFKVLLDSDQSVAGLYNITSIPTSFFINKDGNIVSKRVGAMTEAEMKANINLLKIQ